MTNSSIAEQAVSLMVAALQNVTPAQDRIYRSRAEAIAQELTPCIVVRPTGEQHVSLNSSVNESTLTVAVDIYTRGDPVDQISDPVVVTGHRQLLADASLSNLVDNLRLTSREWEAQESDDTAGFTALKYEMRYMTDRRDLTAVM